MTAEFTLTLHDDQSNAVASSDFLDVAVAVACRGFAGASRFPLARRDLSVFMTDLTAVRHAASDSAQLLGGWDDAEERLRLRITPAGRAGHFVARVRVASTGPRSDLWHRAETEFVCLPDNLSAFLTGLQRLIDQRTPGDATLVGDPEAIA